MLPPAAGLFITASLVGLSLLNARPFDYPETRRDEVTEDFHGVKVVDPFRWLEDDRSKETGEWVKAQNKLTFNYLESIDSRDRISNRLTELHDVERFGVPFVRGGRYFYSRNSGLQNQSVLYTADSADGEARVLLDPNTLSEDGTVALARLSVSDDGRYLAYSVSKAGSDWVEWKVREIESGKDLADHLKWSKFSGAAWSDDNLGFYYSRFDAPKSGDEFKGSNINMKVCYHRLGTPQSDDRVVFQRPDQPKWNFGAGTTDDGRYLIIHVRQGAGGKSALYYQDLEKKDSPVVELIGGFDAHYDFIDSDGSKFWINTDLDAPRRRIIELDLAKPEAKHWKTLVPECGETMVDVGMVGGEFICSYLKDALSVVRRFSESGKPLGEIALPGPGSVRGFLGKRDQRETFFSFESYTSPPTIYRFDFDKGESSVYREPKVNCELSPYESRQVFYQSKDGTRVPMMVVSRKGIALDGNNPTLLYGYGGFNVSRLPRFSTSTIAWLELGGVYVVANLRGGGEYGSDWHRAGMKHNKMNVFDDFIAAAEWLVEKKVTRPEKLAIAGGSNGGLLVGACMTRRPELFGAALPAVGVLDMLHFHEFTIGWAWVKEYGDPGVAEDFKVLYSYSPYHRLKMGTRYPSTMVTTGDHDDRVVPAHSFKFAAALQHAHSGENPVLIRVETDAGHGAGKPTDKRIQETADKWAFLVDALDMENADSSDSE